MKNEKYKLHLFIQNNLSSTKSAEGATTNRAVRKGCYYNGVFLVSAVGATPNKYNRCRSFRPHSLNNNLYDSPIGLPF